MDDNYLDEAAIYHSNERRCERFEILVWGIVMIALISIVSFEIFERLF